MSILDQMAESYGVSTQFLQSRFVNKTDHLYKTYRIEKKYKKYDNGDSRNYRVINHPSKQLKQLHFWLNENLFRQMEVHDAVYSYRKNRSILDAALLHIHNKHFLKLDFSDFFPSIKEENVKCFLGRALNLLPEDLNVVSTLVTFKGALTIGSPCSPVLSNAIMITFDEELSKKCFEHQIVYTRYADDLVFSSKKQKNLHIIEKFIKAFLINFSDIQLTLNTEKTRYLSKNNRVRVLGLTLTSDGNVSLGRDKKREIRQMVYQWKINTLQADERFTELEKRMYLKGYLSFMSYIEPKFVEMLKEKYGSEVFCQIRSFEGLEKETLPIN